MLEDEIKAAAEDSWHVELPSSGEVAIPSAGTIDSRLKKSDKEILLLSSMMSKSDYFPDTGVSPVIFSQVSLPHGKPRGNPEMFTRTNGAYTMKVIPNLVQDPVTGAIERQYPYGIYPRMIIAYLTTVAAKTNDRTVPLGANLSDFVVKNLSLSKGGSTFDSVRQQLNRVFGSQIRFEMSLKSDLGEQKSDVFFNFADTHHEFLPRSGVSAGGSSEWLNEVVLSERFFAEIVKRSVPIDLNVLRHLTTSMAMDVYLWVTHRAPTVDGIARIQWSDLARQFGSQYTELRRFRREFREALKLIAIAYDGLRFDMTDDRYMILYRSPTAIPRNARSRMNAFTSNIITKSIQQ